MDFGICVLAKPDTCAQQAQLAEEYGFSYIWISDTQMMAGDPYVCLALAARQEGQSLVSHDADLPAGSAAGLVRRHPSRPVRSCCPCADSPQPMQ